MTRTFGNSGTKATKVAASLEMQKELGIKRPKALLGRLARSRRVEGKHRKLDFGPATKERVMLLSGIGMSRVDIALVLDVPLASLEAHCNRELLYGTKLFRAKLMEIALSSAKKGSSGAANTLLALNMAAIADQQIQEEGGPMIEGHANPATTTVPRLPHVGKKEQAQVDAVSVAHDHGSEWGSDLDTDGASH